MEQPDAFDVSGFTDGNGADEPLACPLVKLRARTAGIKLVPALWRSHPHWQIAVTLGCRLCGAGLCGSVSVHRRA